MITLQSAKPIHIHLPSVYRYMDEQYIDKFFNDGILRISSFSKFINYPDEIRGDKSEGSGSFLTQSNDGLQYMLGTNVGSDAYMFCTSIIANEIIKAQFNVSSYFKIVKPLEFSAAIMNSLMGATQSYLGFCNYQEYRVIKKQVEGLSIKDFTNDEGNFIIGGDKMNQRNDEIIGNGIDLMFLKENAYQSQSEFRFVWTINRNYFEMQEYVDVYCREAVQFCERIESTV